MPISVTTLGALASTSNVAQYTVALSRAPAANTLVLVSVVHSDSTAPADPSSVSNRADMVYSLVTSVGYDTIATPLHRASVWRSMSATPGSSNISVEFGGNAGTGCIIVVHEFSGVTTSGTSGSGAVGGSTISQVDASSSITLFLPSFASTANAVLVVGGIDLNNNTDAPNSQYIKIGPGNYNTPATGHASGWTSSSGVTQCVFSGAGAADRGAIAVEIVADNPSPGSGAYYTQFYRGLVASGAF